MKTLLAAVAVSLATSVVLARDPARITVVGEEALVFRETPHHVPFAAPEGEAWIDVLRWSGASYIAVHFSKFDLAPGERVIVRTPDGRYSYTFAGEGKSGMGGAFWATHVPGDTCELHYYSSGKGDGFGYVVDRIAHGFPEPARPAPHTFSPEEPLSICGADDSDWAKCYQTSEPQIYDQSRAIARLTIEGTGSCTAWLVGCQGHVLTNNHCIGTSAEAMNTDYEFMAEGASCQANCAAPGGCPGTIVASTGTLIATEAARDFSLVLLPVNPTSTYGFFRMRQSGPTLDERIYIPGHPAGWGKRLAVASTDPADISGFCQINDLDQPSCIGGGPAEVGYACDTQGGSSGSPVVAYSDQKVVALHHCGGCPNTAVGSSDLIAGLGASLPECAVQQFAGSIDLLADRYGCASSLGIRLHDDHLAGMGAHVVTLASTTEPAPESVSLTESPPGSGTFLGSFPATGAAAVHADGHLSVSNGDTITATYIDADDGQGGHNIPRTDTAAVDCAPPVITSVQATNIAGTSAVITWTTDEPADSTVTHGTTPPPGTTSPTNTALVTAHSVTLQGLAPCSAHYFSVSSTDTSGNSTTADNAGAFYSFTTGLDTNPRFTSGDTPIAVPDNTPVGATSTITVPDNKTVQDVNVEVSISHSYDSDLVLTLIPPAGASITLASHRGEDGHDFTGTVFDDEAPGPIGGGAAPFTGSFRPESPLSATDGINAAGPWRLKVVDTAGADTGTLLGWTLALTYPPQVCMPHARYYASALVNEHCDSGGSGDGDGTIDAGERVRFSVTVQNDGSVPLTGVSATVSPLTAGVTMVDGTAGYDTITPGLTGTSLLPHFTAQLPSSLACGSSVGYQVTITADQGTFGGSFSTGVGREVPATGTALSEGFSSGIPAAWTVVDGGSGGGAASSWTTANPGVRPFTAPLTSPVAIVDSDSAGFTASQDETLLSPVMNLAGAVTVTLQYDEFFRWYDGSQDEKGDVDIRSSLTGSAWVNIVRNQGGSNPPGATATGAAHRTLNITAQAAGAGDVQVRFHYYSASWEWWWEIDNVTVTYTAPLGCVMNPCFASPAPPPVPDGTFGTAMTVEKTDQTGSGISVHWDVSTCTSPGYHLLYGPLEGVGAHQITGGVCSLGVSGSYDWILGPGGGCLWFVVVGDDQAGTEGSWGKNGQGAEIGGATASGQCGMTMRNNAASCP